MRSVVQDMSWKTPNVVSLQRQWGFDTYNFSELIKATDI
jgi:hypothetical protein